MFKAKQIRSHKRTHEPWGGYHKQPGFQGRPKRIHAPRRPPPWTPPAYVQPGHPVFGVVVSTYIYIYIYTYIYIHIYFCILLTDPRPSRNHIYIYMVTHPPHDPHLEVLDGWGVEHIHKAVDLPPPQPPPPTQPLLPPSELEHIHMYIHIYIYMYIRVVCLCMFFFGRGGRGENGHLLLLGCWVWRTSGWVNQRNMSQLASTEPPLSLSKNQQASD